MDVLNVPPNLYEDLGGLQMEASESEADPQLTLKTEQLQSINSTAETISSLTGNRSMLNYAPPYTNLVAPAGIAKLRLCAKSLQIYLWKDALKFNIHPSVRPWRGHRRRLWLGGLLCAVFRAVIMFVMKPPL